VTLEPERPGRQTVLHRVRTTGVARLELAGDQARVRERLGEGHASLPLTFVDGPSGIRTVVVGTPEREISLRSDEH
jgi:hypothetical protein